MANPIEHIRTTRYENNTFHEKVDAIVVEEPMEIELTYSSPTGQITKTIAVTMRTPGADKELTAGFLFTEGIISDFAMIESIQVSQSDNNRLITILKENCKPVINNIARNFYSNSSCGICGKASIDSIYVPFEFKNNNIKIEISTSTILQLAEALNKQQAIFKDTGGLHACAYFDNNAQLIAMHEDIGRHNALDKLIGSLGLQNKLPLEQGILFLSGRAGFEMLQKSAKAGIRIIVSIGAPSSLAIELAKEHAITLIGFLRQDRFNIYSNEQCIIKK